MGGGFKNDTQLPTVVIPPSTTPRGSHRDDIAMRPVTIHLGSQAETELSEATGQESVEVEAKIHDPQIE